ncbi:MAG: isochorismatase family protein [Clostridiaceae bacterium]|nr:isochorismatase family protein [Clostridiaceae bacterium]
MHKYTLDREDTVLFVVDIQDRLIAVMKYKDQVIRNNLTLIKTAEEMNFPVIATEQYPKGLGRTAPELLDLIDEENIFTKNCFTAYTDEVAAKLKALGKKKVLLSGSETHICVFQTARDLTNDGYEVFLVRDAVCSRTKENFLNGLDLIKSMGGVITNTESALYDLLKVSGTPEFKKLSQLIK